MRDDHGVRALSQHGRNPFIRAVGFIKIKVQAADVNSDHTKTSAPLKLEADLLPRESEGDGGTSRVGYMQRALIGSSICDDAPTIVGDQRMRIVVSAGSQRDLRCTGGCDDGRVRNG